MILIVTATRTITITTNYHRSTMAYPRPLELPGFSPSNRMDKQPSLVISDLI